MNFYSWKKNDILLLNKYGIPEPIKSQPIVPDIMFLPLLSFDRFKNFEERGQYFNYLINHYKIKNAG